ncbi:beta-galactoside alpha-2,6-sialyltransferase 2 [Trichomycterus rosablanca]|uniref:beta-galactoside alpha-2,6-sialyltransferase 2 n=1 Tax=Trichomycterus rosablanca TaxID=2290929 RepID=UPI002F35EC34
MKTSLKQWRRLGLGLMITWVLIFLALFSYFMDSRVNESAPLSHTDKRRLTAVQGHTRSSMLKAQQDLPATSVSTASNAQNLSSEQHQDVYPEAQNLAAWSAFGTQDVSSLLNRSREKVTQVLFQREEDEEVEMNNEVDQAKMNKNEAKSWDDSNFDDFYSSRTKSVVQHLRQGSVSLNMLSARLQRAASVYMNNNSHGVDYKGQRQEKQSRERLLCEMKRKGTVKTLDGKERPFSKLGWHKVVPRKPLNRLYGAGFGSCAVVTSAGAMLHSSLGKEIDSHDAVLRFNSAPTKGYERDVGNKTTIRIINSQIVANPAHKFITSSLYKDTTLVAWDPAPYTVNLDKWYKNPDYNLFTPYSEYRKKFRDQPFYILHPTFIWQLWDVIQSNFVENIQPNPPSSGFIGILLMMSLCKEVHVYEFIPSLRHTDLCHYHERYYDAACTLGAYHPLLFEKNLIQRINNGSKKDLHKKGKITLPGFSTVHCDP